MARFARWCGRIREATPPEPHIMSRLTTNLCLLLAACLVTACNSQKRPARTGLASEGVMTRAEPAAGIHVAREDMTRVEPAAGIQVAGGAGPKGIVQYFEFKTDADAKRVEAEADAEPKSPELPVEIDNTGHRVSRKDESGRIMW